jgi:DNA-directed RNA polymerase subunit omega
MARITVEDCLNRENNRFSLVLLAAKRTKQLLRGQSMKIGDNKNNKAVVTALREIAAGQVRFMTEAEAEEARLLAEQKRAERIAQQSSQMPGAPLDIPLPTLNEVLTPISNGAKNGAGDDEEE